MEPEARQRTTGAAGTAEAKGILTQDRTRADAVTVRKNVSAAAWSIILPEKENGSLQRSCKLLILLFQLCSIVVLARSRKYWFIGCRGSRTNNRFLTAASFSS